LRWWRWLRVIGIDWHKTTSADVKCFVLWLLSTTKEREARSFDFAQPSEKSIVNKPL